MSVRRFGSGTLWIDIEVSTAEDRLTVNENGRPLRGSPIDLAVVGATAAQNPDGTLTVEASVGTSEQLSKLQPMMGGRLRIGTDAGLAPGAQRYVELTGGGVTSVAMHPVALVAPKTDRESGFEGVCLYNARLDVSLGADGLYLVAADGYAASERLGSQNQVGYIGDHALA